MNNAFMFNVGDRIKSDIPFFGECEGTITEILPANNSSQHTIYVVDIDVIQGNINYITGMWLLEKDITLINKSNNATINISFHNSSEFDANWNMPVELIKDDVCFHDWKLYVGLEKKFDYCTKCDKIKNEKGIYE